ncbi:MAG: leucine--tRNA ligase, partial [Chloroflexi bacterium]|nr:leucine--tRNA ligase [Chloroflexota bacterium]
VLAPEHPLVPLITTPERRAEVQAYIEQARRRTEIERLSTDREKTGVFTGARCRNLLSGQDVPIWIADYALLWYGTGAVMGVPAHDQRDFEFAANFGIPVRVVIAPDDWGGSELQQAYLEPGAMVNSGQFDGLPSDEGKNRIADYVESSGWGRRTVSYRMRDWLISRQRYWGAPIPIIYCPDCGEIPVPEDDLPVLLPPVEQYEPSGTGKSPLANVPEFVQTTCPRCQGSAERETDTMGGFACSSWYFLRFTSPHYDQGPFEPDAMRFWLPVDLYVGGAVHAVMHLLYARFWTKVMYDAGLVPFKEPFAKLMNQGIVHAADGQRMSKSKGNVITPDTVVERHGADALRGYELFMAPFEMNVNWSDEGVRGVSRWLHRLWNLILTEPGFGEPDPAALRAMRRLTHQTIRRASEEMDEFRFNTLIAGLMEMTNGLTDLRDSGPVDRAAWQEAVESLLLMLAPIAPHIAEELWARTGRPYSIHQQAWPAWDAELVREEEITLVVQVNGKLRDRIQVGADIDEARARELALSSPQVRKHIDNCEVQRVIYVPGKLVNVVVK